MIDHNKPHLEKFRELTEAFGDLVEATEILKAKFLQYCSPSDGDIAEKCNHLVKMEQKQ